MSVKSVLNGCHEALNQASRAFRWLGKEGDAEMCSLQADAVLKLLADLDNEQQEETSADD